MERKEKTSASHFRGCLLGGAAGDALGAVTEFMSLNEIYRRFGHGGVTEFEEFSDGRGAITDDTQMTLFTAEGMLRAWHRLKDKGTGGLFPGITFRSYIAWLHTQGERTMAQIELDSFLLNEKKLYRRRAPGMTCLSALRGGEPGSITNAINNSKGCGGIMRTAPIGLLIFADPEEAFRLGTENGALTHSHPSGYLPAGFFSAVIALLCQGFSLENAVETSVSWLKNYKGHEETLEAVMKALKLFHSGAKPTFEAVEALGGGWTGEEALAISLYCALCFEDDYEKGVILAVNHSGDTDSTGAITGNLLGLINGEERIPSRWLKGLELRELISSVADDLLIAVRNEYPHYPAEWVRRYPPF